MKHRGDLPQLHGGLFVCDGGIETTLIFKEGIDLPDFAAFDVLREEDGEALLSWYFMRYAEIAKRHRVGLILESATWRASSDWGDRLGYSRDELADANRRAIRVLTDVRAQVEPHTCGVVISGCIGPRGDGYQPDRRMTVDEARRYHSEQIDVFGATDADLVTAMTMNYPAEAAGIAAAAREAGMPVVISFTVETDGRLPDGQHLRQAISEVDEATSGYPAYYMINCAHPSHFSHLFGEDAAWARRIRGVRANASRQSHAELNESPVLDDGDPEELAREYAGLTEKLPLLSVVGGCCGTDERHVERIVRACIPLVRARGAGLSAGTSAESPMPA